MTVAGVKLDLTPSELGDLLMGLWNRLERIDQLEAAARRMGDMSGLRKARVMRERITALYERMKQIELPPTLAGSL